ncbi:hypothetical protein EG329_010571 [Mollisiaceae sp. DMI_Dod_QoI]|nr:hypothetical protein EG329_010571 [Helotiales sp. DMI_Dod_QoI]
MPVAVTAVAGTVTVVNGTFTLVQTFYKLAAVDEDLKICLELLANADRDLNYARSQLRSRKSSQSHVRFSTIDLGYFESVIEKMEDAALALGELVQCYRVERDVNNSISIGSRFKWVLQGKDKFSNRQEVLRMAHASLLGVIQRLGTVVPVVSQFVAPPPYNSPYLQASPANPTKILRSPSQQRALKGKRSMILRSEDMDPQEPSMPTPQTYPSGQSLLRPSLPTVPRDRRVSRTAFAQRIAAVREELEYEDYSYPEDGRY